jgi:hypothetical protein
MIVSPAAGSGAIVYKIGSDWPNVSGKCQRHRDKPSGLRTHLLQSCVIPEETPEPSDSS